MQHAVMTGQNLHKVHRGSTIRSPKRTKLNFIQREKKRHSFMNEHDEHIQQLFAYFILLCNVSRPR